MIASPPLPMNLDAERSVLATILLDNSLLHVVREMLQPADFFLDQHRRILRRMMSMSESQKGIDLVTLTEELHVSGEIEVVGGAAYVAQLADGMLRVSNIRDYTEIIKEKSLLRCLIRLGEEAQKPEAKPSDLMQRVYKAMERGVASPGAAAPDLVKLSDVQASQVEWLFYPYIPLGKLTMLVGAPGEGKTFAAIAWAADITRGIVPGTEGQETREPANVLYATAEDGLADTIRPRFSCLDGNAERFIALKGVITKKGQNEELNGITLSDIALLDDALTQTRPALLVIDPLQAFLGADVDFHRANEVRPALTGLSRLAEKHRCAVVLITHLSKSQQDRPLYRMLGSVDFAAVARSVLLAGTDPSNPDRRAVVHLKSSLAPCGKAQGYSLTSGRFEWTELEEAAAERGISSRTLRRARKVLSIRHTRRGYGGPWIWSLPDDKTAADIDDGQAEKTGAPTHQDMAAFDPHIVSGPNNASLPPEAGHDPG